MRAALALTAALALCLGCDLLDAIVREVAVPLPGAPAPGAPGGGGPPTPASDTPAGQGARDALARCQPDTLVERQNRTVMKHRPPPPTLAGALATTAGEMFTWPPPAVLGQRGVRDSQEPIDPRETALYMLDVDVVLAKLADDDCDLHLEVTAPGAGPLADRVILELPQGAAFDGMRYGLADALGRRGRGFGRAELSPPMRARVAGYAFYDAHHACSRDRQRGCTHGTARVGTLWELHPVVALGLGE